MSRIGKNPIQIPDKVKVTVSGQRVFVEGPKGKLEHDVHPRIRVTAEEGRVSVARSDNTRLSRSLHGLTRALIANMVRGVKEGFQKTLEIQGVGYRATKQGAALSFQLGYSHPIVFEPPQGIELFVDRNIVTVAGIDKQVVGQVAAHIRALRRPEPYKGKGIRYVGERVRRKAGKAGL
ncbi:MAG: 50S ribosomal protein L6 [Candidatus Abyssobacteria bacterium SURF_17]|jgi:large subunit ribosomal protein L6|uniref:Large ribosomal subunit protein uL6 n=1 Tax=Candidatus Abyssobacteria bacterium SURF_17 TaxID=2093361 RepID=A0A419EVJ6_9BACT|nr:MAG: 50S ribosomal protein L6 [Candidatus Abyssubacteria bacterium SURF_17]